MERNELTALIDNGLSTRNIAKHLKLSQTTIRYWLKKYKLKTQKEFNSHNWIIFPRSSAEYIILTF